MMPEVPGDLFLMWCMILFNSLVKMGKKEGSRMSMLEWGSGWKESEMAVVFFCDEFNVLLVKIFVILIVSEGL